VKISVHVLLSFDPSNLAFYKNWAAMAHSGFGMYLMNSMLARAFVPKLNPMKQFVFADE
jgi:hypothetical protein